MGALFFYESDRNIKAIYLYLNLVSANQTDSKTIFVLFSSVFDKGHNINDSFIEVFITCSNQRSGLTETVDPAAAAAAAARSVPNRAYDRVAACCRPVGIVQSCRSMLSLPSVVAVAVHILLSYTSPKACYSYEN